MRILLLTYYFPPYNTIGAVRTGKTAKYLAAMGHDVRVIAAADPMMEQPDDRSLSVELPADRVTYTKWVGVNNPGEALLRNVLRERGKLSTGGRVSSLAMVPRPLRRLAHFVASATNIPDPYIGWFPFALRACWRLIEDWRPDVIYASGWPFTAFLVADVVSRRQGVPWVAEYRDLWVEHEPYSFQRWRKPVDACIERAVVASAREMVTVSQPLAECLRGKHGKPVTVVTNGFDPCDRPAATAPTAGDQLEVVYTGQIFEQERDISPLFKAVALLGTDAARVRVNLYLRGDVGGVRRQVQAYGVEGSVNICPPVPYAEALRRQAEADVLLIASTSAQHRGKLTGKFFEYIGARRPILAVGTADSVMAEMITQHGLGRVLADPPAISEALRLWLTQKKAGGVPGLGDEHIDVFTREHQTRRLEAVLTGA